MIPVSFFKNSKWLGLYDLRYLSKPLETFSFPHVTTLAVIRCSHRVIPELITPRHFPNVQTIHYLSLDPGSATLHRNFQPSVRWVFPTIDYPFYEKMVTSGYGYYDSNLIGRYIPSFYRANGRLAFRLAIPGHSMVDGPLYKRTFYEYIIDNKMYNRMCSYDSIPVIQHPPSSHDMYMKKYIQHSFMNCLSEEEENERKIIHLGATPCHNSGK